MRSLKNLKNKIINHWTILLVCSLGAIVSLFLSFCLCNKWSNIFGNLFASFIIIIFTVFIIDQLLEKQRLAKFINAHNIAKKDLEMLGNMLISYMSAPFGFNIFQYNCDDNVAIDTILDQMLKMNFEKKLNDLSKDGWEHLMINLVFIKDNLHSKISLYSDILPAEILGKLLIVNSSFSSLNSLFGLYIVGTKKIDHRQLLIKNLATDLENYFSTVKDFLISLNKWKK